MPRRDSELSRYVTVSDAARRLNVTTMQVYRLIRQGKISAVRVGEGRGIWLVHRGSLVTRQSQRAKGR